MLMDYEALERMTSEKGRFRTFLKATLRNFISNVEDYRRAIKRGGVRPPLRLDALDDDLVSSEPFERCFDREWKRTLYERPIGRLQERLRAAGKETVFEVFREYYLEPEAMSYREIADRHGIKETDVGNGLQFAKEMLRRIVEDEARQTVRDEPSLRDEIRELFGDWK